MAQVKQRNKLKPKDQEKIKARYFTMLEKFKAMSGEEFKEAITKRMSFTDRCAAVDAARIKQLELKKQQEEANGEDTNAGDGPE